MKRVAIGLFLLAPSRFIEFMLIALTYHPWLLAMNVAAFWALVVWLLRASYYGDESEEPSKT
jgi:hypothetical protein